jgi:hypothetical protein
VGTDLCSHQRWSEIHVDPEPTIRGKGR